MTNDDLWHMGLETFYIQPGALQSLCAKFNWEYRDVADACDLSYSIISRLAWGDIKANPERVGELAEAFGYSFDWMHDHLVGTHCQIPRWHHVYHINGGHSRSDIIDGTSFCAAKCESQIPTECDMSCDLTLGEFEAYPLVCECRRPTSPARKKRFLTWVRGRLRHLDTWYAEHERIRELRYQPWMRETVWVTDNPSRANL